MGGELEKEVKENTKPQAAAQLLEKRFNNWNKPGLSVPLKGKAGFSLVKEFHCSIVLLMK
jgi:hypothetical protein